jgi:HlyD family secretion protein
MKRKLVITLVSLLILALLVWIFMPSPLEVEIATVTQGRFERSVQEDGKTRLRERYVVSTPLSGRLARIELKQGDSVQRGTVVATLWPSAPSLLDERARAEQVARIAALQAAVSRTQANVARAGAALDRARAELKRSEALAQQGFVSPNQNETDSLNVRLREKELEVAQQDENAARHELQQAGIALGQFLRPAPKALARTFAIHAPVSGKILKVLQQSEGAVTAGTPLLELGDATQLEVIVDLLTEDASQIKPGTAVQISNWGGPAVLAGQVRLIEPAAFTKVSALGVEEQRVNAIIDITSPTDQWHSLGDGFKTDVRVLVEVVENAIMVPVSALFPVGAQSALFMVDDSYAHLRVIDVAARNGVQAWLKTALRPGTQVIVYPDSKLKNGDSVTPRQTSPR